jgi:uncharacterized damage-inducible protein DinB
MKYNSNTLLESLQDDVRQIILEADKLKTRVLSDLDLSPAPGKWSAAQVLEHLNVYNRFYLNAIEQKIHMNQHDSTETFSPGWLGNYFTNIMKPKNGNSIPKKMNAPKNAVPSEKPDARAMLEEFISHQHHLLNLLKLAKSTNLNSIRIPTSLSKLITLKLGDTFRFFIAHEQRHFVQIHSIMNMLQIK